MNKTLSNYKKNTDISFFIFIIIFYIMENLDQRNLNISHSSLNNIQYNDIQKMVFLCNALNDGWSIKKLKNNKYEFIKHKEQVIKKEIDLEEFIKFNLNIENIKK